MCSAHLYITPLPGYIYYILMCLEHGYKSQFWNRSGPKQLLTLATDYKVQRYRRACRGVDKQNQREEAKSLNTSFKPVVCSVFLFS
jgi:hypothetical protein